MNVLPPELWGEIQGYLCCKILPGRHGYTHGNTVLGLLSQDVQFPDPTEGAPIESDPGDVPDYPSMQIDNVQCTPDAFKMDMVFRDYGAKQIARLRPMLAHVARITLYNCKITDAGALRDIPHVTLSQCPRLADIGALGRQQSLCITDCPKILDYSGLAAVPTLHLYRATMTRLFAAENETLTLGDCANLTDIGALQNVSNFALHRCRNITTGWQALANVADTISIMDVDILALPALRARRIHISNSNVRDVSRLSCAAEVRLDRCPNVGDVSPLAGVRSVRLERCEGVRDVTALRHVKILELFDMDLDCTSLGGAYHLDIRNDRAALLQHACIADLAALRNCYRLIVYRQPGVRDAARLLVAGANRIKVRHLSIS